MKKIYKTAVLFFLGCILCGCGAGRGSTVLVGKSAVETEASGDLQTDGAKDAAEETADRVQAESAEAETAPEEELFRVYVCGAVQNPGVVSLPVGSRAEDALNAAGGFAPGADETCVNLADWVTDGQKLYFPEIGEASSEVSGSSSSDGLVNINTADVSLLCSLPGIGEARAQDIIAYREANGGFEAPEDIMKVSGIKTSVYSKISDKIKVK